jgi:Yippee zinc-binding/DNA-binding /Mis18, centromere assembly
VSAPAEIFALRRDEARPAGDVRPASRPLAEDGGGEVLACAGCLRPVTTSAARIEVAGAHEHTFANAAGFQFRIGCFARAIGCATVGEPSTYWTWFPGCSWQIEQCSSCGEHLGWLFRSASEAFHGLVLDRLVEVES